MRPLSLPVFLLLTATAPAQMLLVPAEGDPAELHFNPLFMERNRIAAVHGERMVKQDNKPMRGLPGKYLYRFDEQGRRTYANHSFGHPGTGRDTASIVFAYDAGGHMVRSLRNDLVGHFAYDLRYDDQGRPVRETYSRIENRSTDRYKLLPGAVTEISDEHYRYEAVNDTVWRRVYVNSNGLPYRERTYTSDALGYLLRIEDRYLVSNRRSLTSFRYDEKGRLAERTDQPDRNVERTDRRTWTYDAAGNVLAEELWHDGRHAEHIEYMYEEHTMLLKARLSRDNATGSIHVVRYTTDKR
ncbi:MAG: hypothetical protein RBT71_08285 [Flavobacteriales bacterium]|jgi:YD repeat-containing protein|nr:hypothetical protein [Flavobacteriales bacterium]